MPDRDRGRPHADCARLDRIGARVLLVLHGTFFVVGTAEAAAGRMSVDGTLALGSWLGLIHFETLVFVIGTAIFTVAMARERAELQYMAASRIDSLTGISNRCPFWTLNGADTLSVPKSSY